MLSPQTAFTLFLDLFTLCVLALTEALLAVGLALKERSPGLAYLSPQMR